MVKSLMSECMLSGEVVLSIKSLRGKDDVTTKAGLMSDSLTVIVFWTEGIALGLGMNVLCSMLMYFQGTIKL